MSRDVLLFVSVFLASAVEGVEAVTIVLAAGLTRGWRSALAGVGVALVLLAAIVAVLGPALTVLPITTVRLIVGGLLLVFGLQWLRKAILRGSGFKPLHDEDAVLAQELAAARAAGREPDGIDGYGFTLAFKGVLLEGLEVAFIAVTVGASQHNVGLAALAAGAAVVAGRRGRHRRARPARPGAREHPQVRRRRDARPRSASSGVPRARGLTGRPAMRRSSASSRSRWPRRSRL